VEGRKEGGKLKAKAVMTVKFLPGETIEETCEEMLMMDRCLGKYVEGKFDGVLISTRSGSRIRMITDYWREMEKREVNNG
jgi:hypothetical protein